MRYQGEDRVPWRRRTVFWLIPVVLLTAPAAWWGLNGGTGPQDGPAVSDYAAILDVPPGGPPPSAAPDGSAGSYRHDCGRNENGFYSSESFFAVPGERDGKRPLRDYLGNLSVDRHTTDASLAAAEPTSCRFGDQSTYFWPVLRSVDGTRGRILPPADVRMEFLGNPRSKVVAMPRFLRLVTGDARAVTSGPAFARSRWACAGYGQRSTAKYPLCPDGTVQRVIEYPSCWNGHDLRSGDARSHTAFPGADGRCPAGTLAIPKLVVTLAYTGIRPGRTFALDAFPGERRSPQTEHAGFENVMPSRLMAVIVDCINDGRAC